MTQVYVKLAHLRTAPRKVRLVIDVIRGTKTDAALDQLAIMPQRAAGPIRKLVLAAIDAAKAKGLTDDKLWIQSVRCDQGPALKRRLINSRGRASMIKKFTSHIHLTVTDQKQARKGRS